MIFLPVARDSNLRRLRSADPVGLHGPEPGGEARESSAGLDTETACPAKKGGHARSSVKTPKAS
ncbi:hypothetical protein PQJ73_21235, partial [Rhodoplanes tepidamans]